MVSEKATNVSVIEDEDELDEEPGEVIESAPPLKVGEERELNSSSGVKKKLLKLGHGWETPGIGDEATVHYVGTLLDGTKFDSTRDRDEPVTLKLGQDQVATGLDQGIITMKKGETALFTLQDKMRYKDPTGVPPGSVIQFEVELISWITVVDICKDGGMIKKIMEKGERNERPTDLDEVLVEYLVTLVDGTLVAKSPEGGVEFYIKDGHMLLGLPKAIMSMRRGEKAKLIVQPQYAFGEKGRDASNGVHSVPPNSVLNVDVELVSFKPVIDVTGDSKVLKKTLKEGVGASTAGEGATVTVTYVASLEGGTVFERRGIDGQQPLEFITDEEQVVVGLDRAVASMKKGERAAITIHPDFGFQSDEVTCDLATVPPGSTIIYEVEMLDFVKEKAPWELNNNEKIEAASRKKEEGNLLFKNGKYHRAGKKYDQAVDYVSEDGLFEESEQKQIKTLSVSCWLNRAACSLKLHDFQGAVTLCSKVLDVESCNVKALYRRAQAYIEIGDLILADLDIKKALEASPNNREIKLIQEKLKQHQVERNKRDAKLYANMFAPKRMDSPVPTKKLKVEKPAESKDEVGNAEIERVDDNTDPSYNGTRSAPSEKD